MVEVKLPPTFYEDHAARDLPAGEITGMTDRHVVVRLDRAAYEDLLSDARYYTDAATAASMGLPGLASSARATIKRLEAIDPPEADEIEPCPCCGERRWNDRPGCAYCGVKQ